jgi:hypothetical protein
MTAVAIVGDHGGLWGLLIDRLVLVDRMTKWEALLPTLKCVLITCQVRKGENGMRFTIREIGLRPAVSTNNFSSRSRCDSGTCDRRLSDERFDLHPLASVILTPNCYANIRPVDVGPSFRDECGRFSVDIPYVGWSCKTAYSHLCARQPATSNVLPVVERQAPNTCLTFKCRPSFCFFLAPQPFLVSPRFCACLVSFLSSILIVDKGAPA